MDLMILHTEETLNRTPIICVATMSVKQLLKSAKAAIEANDAEDALYYIEEALKLDKDNYYAYVFQGKSYQLLAKWDKAEVAFRKATQLEPQNLLGWKGFFQVVKSQDDYGRFFAVLTDYIDVLVSQELPIADAVKDVYNYLNARKYQSYPELHEFFLRAILPDTKLGQLLGNAMGTPEQTLKKLIVLLKNSEEQEVREALAKEKLKLPRVLTAQLKARLNEIEWAIRQQSSLSELYEQFLNCCEDDDLRRHYDIELLKYKYNLLKLVPNKKPLLADIKERAEDLVLLDTDDIFAWSLNLDLMDPKLLNDLDEALIFRFIKKFKQNGLGVILFLFVVSDMCTFSKDKVKELIAYDSNTREQTPVDDELTKDTLIEQDEANEGYSPSEVLDLMLQGYARCTDSMLAHRIVCDYYIFIQEYEAGTEKCTLAIKQLAELQRTYDIDLVNCKEDILCLLATVYTYHEAPKNFSRAHQLYDRILHDTPDNKQALIGKGLILLEKRELDGASKLLKQVALAHPDDPRTLSEFGWCKVLQKGYQEGRELLRKALENLQTASPATFEMRAAIHWRLAKSLLLENTSPENIKAAFDLLIQSLKDSKNYAPSYTLLGVLYYDHYDDKARAQKCFYKAFELDVAEITAAKYLVTDLAEGSEWEITEILCKRVVTSEKSRRMLFSQLYEDPDKSWPYRVLGCSALNKQDDAKAIEWFQTALRMKAMDTECWTGLGEAYYNCGRLDAAIKVFQHTTKTNPDSWVNWYMLGLCVCEVGDYLDGLKILQKSLEMSPDTECILNAIYEQSINQSVQFLKGGFIGRTLQANKTAIETLRTAVKLNKSSQRLWKALGDCLKLISKVQLDIENFPIEIVLLILNEVEGIDDELASVAAAMDEFSNLRFAQSICMLEILTARAAIAVLPKKVNKYLRSLTQFNLGLSYLDMYNSSDEGDVRYQEQAVVSFKAAIQLEPGSAQYWIALGNAHVSLDPQIAQHCFIKASVLDSRDINVWSNLASLYLRYGDAELAQEAFDRATSVSPENYVPWLGNALAAEVNGDKESASRLTTHAYILSNGRSPLAQLCYASSIVANRIGHSADARDIDAAQEFSIANYAIQSFLKFQPNNETGLKLAFLLSERCSTFHTSIEVGQKLCDLLEKKYEQTESSAAMLDYAKAKTALARVYLGVEDYEKAIENAQLTLDILLEEEASKDVTDAILSSRIVIGLSFFFNDQFNEALEEFRLILSEEGLSQRAVTLVAQVLYAYDTPDTKQAALDQLFSFIEKYGSSLVVVLTLGCISVVENLEEYFLPVKEELENLPLSELIGDNYRMVPKLLKEISDRITGKDSTKIWQKFALLFPSDFNIWRNLDTHMALSTAMLSDSKRTAMEVSTAYLKQGSRREIQRALLLCADNTAARQAIYVPH